MTTKLDDQVHRWKFDAEGQRYWLEVPLPPHGSLRSESDVVVVKYQQEKKARLVARDEEDGSSSSEEEEEEDDEEEE